YVDLPDTILTGLTNATLEAWVTWPGSTPSNWQRIFDFGSTASGTAGAYIFLATRISASGGCRAAIATMGSGSETAAGGAQINGPVISSGAHHFVLIIDDTGDTVSLYVDGTLGSTVGFTGTIASIIGANNWLGRSNFSADPYFGGTFDEVRIYNVALTVAQLRSSRTAGPNASFL
ncbi:MAG TPA: LamG domain-containing protein, partial [Polyangiaceae bacterium]